MDTPSLTLHTSYGHMGLQEGEAPFHIQNSSLNAGNNYQGLSLDPLLSPWPPRVAVVL